MNGNNGHSTGGVGANARRIDAPGKVTGATLYPGDIDYPNMLHMATLFAHRVHARVVSVDTAGAELAPGVVMVLTSKDVPVNEYGLQIKDQPVLCGPGGDKPGTDVVRFVGDQIALVVAETEVEARSACKLIKVEWEDLPVVLDPEEAMRPGAPQIHPHSQDNICYSYRIRKGDIDKGFAEADVIVEGVYQTPVQEHAYLQPEAGVARLDQDGRITIEVAGQWTHVDQESIAHALALPGDRVRVIYPAIGGAFGGREDMSVQITLALCVLRLAERGIKRPVKTIWSREESMFGHGKRHAMKLYAKWGAKRDGTLVAVEVKAIADGGAYMYTSNKVLGNTTLTCTGPYEIPHVAVDTYAIYTNHVPGAAFRGFGGPQGHFEAEGQMDKLAEALGMDPVELRMKNILTEDKLLTVGTPIPGGVGLTAVVTAAAKAAGWTQGEDGRWAQPLLTTEGVESVGELEAQAGNLLNASASSVTSAARKSAVRRGIGFAAGFKNVGFSFGYQENSYARVEVRGAGEMAQADVFFAGADCGQGNHTIISQAAAEVLGIPVEKVCVIASDTARMGNAGSASASRLTYMSANAVKGAAEKALAAWKNEDRPAVGEYVYLAPKTTPLDHDTGYGKPNFAYGYTAQAVQVAVDTETGQVKIEGAVVQALGYTLLEDWKTKDGRVLTDKLSTYLIPTVLDVPEQMESIVVEVPDPNGPWGARGMGEVPYLPVAAAVAAAVYDAVGVRYDEFPLTPERVWAGLRAARRQKQAAT